MTSPFPRTVLLLGSGELGKEVATTLTEPLSQSIVKNNFDSSTNGLLEAILEQQEQNS